MDIQKKPDRQGLERGHVRGERLTYEPPRVIVHSEEALLDALKATRACSGFGGSVIGC